MFLNGERNYQLHEFIVSLVGDPTAQVWLLDDQAGQVLGFDGKLRQVELTNTWLWDMPSKVDEIRLEPTVRDVSCSLLMASNALTLEVDSLHTHYRRKNVYEEWMAPFQRVDPIGSTPPFFKLRRLTASLNRRQVALEIEDDGNIVTVQIGGIANLDCTIDARNDNAFVSEVDVRPLRPEVKISLEDVSRTLGVHGPHLTRRLEQMRELWLAGPNLNLSVVVELPG